MKKIQLIATLDIEENYISHQVEHIQIRYLPNIKEFYIILHFPCITMFAL